MKRSHGLLMWLGATALVMACAKGAGDNFGTFGGSVPGGAAGDDGDDDEGGDAQATDGGGSPMSGPAEEDGGDEGAPEGGAGDCCAGNGTPGCEDAAIAACVCAQDAFCCDSVWDDICASMVGELGCADCAGDPGDGGDPGGDGAPPADDGGAGDAGTDDGSDPGGTSGPPDPPGDGGDEGGGGFGDCCMANNSPGCDDAGIEACVCAVDSYCCDTDWDSICVDLVASESCGDCGGGGGGETGEPPAGDTGGGTVDADCCTAHDGAGCADAAIEACVCAADGFCCSTEWDAVCVDQVTSLACGDCGGGTTDPTAGTGGETGGGPVPGACCMATGTPGCPGDPAVEACVCAADAFCCDVEWDGICVDQVTSEACGTC